MDELIRKQDIIDIIINEGIYCDTDEDKAYWVQRIKDIPSIQNNKESGRWLPYLKEGLKYKCSKCGSRYDTPWHYCPNCGIKMLDNSVK